jgi:hypothetical protein
MAKIGKQHTTFTASETGGTTIAENEGFVVNADTDIAIQLRADSALDTISLLKGIHYAWDIVGVDVSNATAATVVWVIRAQEH